MANTATNVSVGKPKTSGAIYRAPSGTTLPTSTSEDLDEAFVCLGYVSEDGVTNSNEIDSDSIQAWGGDTVLPFQVSRTVSFQFTLIESLNVDVLKTVYGDDNVSGDLERGITIKANSDELPSSAWIIDMINRDGGYHRIVIPNATITDIGDISYTDDEAIGYEITITAVPDENGQTHYEYKKRAS